MTFAPCCRSHSIEKFQAPCVISLVHASLKSGLASPIFPSAQQTPDWSRPLLPKMEVADWPGLRKKQPSEQPNPPTRNPVVSPPGSSITRLRFIQKLPRDTHWKSGRLSGAYPSATSMPRLRSLPPFRNWLVNPVEGASVCGNNRWDTDFWYSVSSSVPRPPHTIAPTPPSISVSHSGLLPTFPTTPPPVTALTAP